MEYAPKSKEEQKYPQHLIENHSKITRNKKNKKKLDLITLDKNFKSVINEIDEMIMSDKVDILLKEYDKKKQNEKINSKKRKIPFLKVYISI